MNKELEQYLCQKNLEYLKEYLNLILTKASLHEEELKKFQQHIYEEYLKGGNDPEFFETDEDEDLAVEQMESRQVMYRSFIVSVFMFMEHLTNNVCDALKVKTGQVFSYKDLSNSGIGRSTKYLKKVLGEHPIKNQTVQEDFAIAQIVRNAIVHSEGILYKEDVERIEKLIKVKKTFLQLILDEVDITHEYAESVLELSKKYSEEMLQR